MTSDSSATSALPCTTILMGVSGCGKSHIGQRLADATGGIFEDADSYHTAEAKEKMRAGIPLTDTDRRPWYERLRARIDELRGQPRPFILACSALRRLYREWLRAGDSEREMGFVFLDGSFDLIHARATVREHDYMPVSLLRSQFETLEVPDAAEALRVSIDAKPEEIVATILSELPKRAI